MTTHDYHGDTDPSLTQVEPTTARTDRGAEQSDLSTSADASDLPRGSTASADQWSTAATDPGPAATDPGRAATDRSGGDGLSACAGGRLHSWSNRTCEPVLAAGS